MKIHLLDLVAVDLQKYCILSCILESLLFSAQYEKLNYWNYQRVYLSKGSFSGFIAIAGFKQAQLKDVHFYCEAFLEHTVVLTVTY